MSNYKIIYADPAWVYQDKAKKKYYSDEAMNCFFKEVLVLLKENNKLQKEVSKQLKYVWQSLDELEPVSQDKQDA